MMIKTEYFNRKSSHKSYCSIVQITDLHLIEDEKKTFLGVNTWSILDAVLEEIYSNADIDFIVFTGDLIHDDETLAYCLLFDRLKSSPYPVYIIPGNHDDKSTLFFLLEQKYNNTNIKMITHLHLISDNWQIFLLDSVVDNEVYGELKEHELSYLEDILHDSKENTLIFLHHNPFNINNAWLNDYTIKNSDRFLDLIFQHSHVKIVSFGHIHQDLHLCHNGISFLATPSTSIQFKPDSHCFCLDNKDPGYRIIQLYNSENPHLFSTEVIRLDMPTLQFDQSISEY